MHAAPSMDPEVVIRWRFYALSYISRLLELALAPAMGERSIGMELRIDNLTRHIRWAGERGLSAAAATQLAAPPGCPPPVARPLHLARRSDALLAASVAGGWGMKAASACRVLSNGIADMPAGQIFAWRAPSLISVGLSTPHVCQFCPS